jgi:uncharacterized alkaline shock family protein YloU
MKRIIHHIAWIAKGIKVFALVGKSGTGKSFRAKLIADKNGIELIIDDGLLIGDHKILAGKSAKKEKAYMTAVKTALFHEKDHRHEVMSAMKKEKFKRILIIGTSEGMVKKIADKLELPSPHQIIQIEEIATEEEIEVAIQSRKMHGKHVIPVPAIEVKKTHPLFQSDTLRLFIKKNIPFISKDKIFEKSVVRPEFSRKGRVTISESALTQMILHCINEFTPGVSLTKMTVRNDVNGYKIDLTVSVTFGSQLSGKIQELQRYIVDSLEKYTGILIEELNIVIDSVS